jgi:hypothetical protein
LLQTTGNYLHAIVSGADGFLSQLKGELMSTTNEQQHERKKLPFALLYGQRPTITEKTDEDAEWLFKVTQTSAHTTKPRTPGKPSKHDKS